MRKCSNILTFHYFLANLGCFDVVVNCLYFLVIIPNIYGKWNPQWNEFERQLCRDRWYRIDWQSVMLPCKDRMIFGSNLIPEYLRTSAARTYMTTWDIKPAGEYSRFIFQSIDTYGNLKTFGGDTWRVFIRGPSSLAPYVYDLNNGKYEAPFLIMEPGHYSVEIYLEGSLCSGYMDPPADWFIKGKCSWFCYDVFKTYHLLI